MSTVITLVHALRVNDTIIVSNTVVHSMNNYDDEQTTIMNIGQVICLDMFMRPHHSHHRYYSTAVDMKHSQVL